MDYKLLENAPLFKDVPPEEINVMLQCLGTEERDYDKGETIFHAGDVIHNIGLVLTGRVHPSLTVKFIKTPLKALFYLGFSAVPFRFTI